MHSHAAAALINFCEGVERDTLLPYLDPIVERLFKLLNPDGDQTQVKRYVQEQVITTLAMVADASEAMFAKVPCPLSPVPTRLLIAHLALWVDHATSAECTEKRGRAGV